jgi:hypothetical protein
MHKDEGDGVVENGICYSSWLLAIDTQMESCNTIHSIDPLISRFYSLQRISANCCGTMELPDRERERNSLSALTTDTTSQLNVLRHDGDTLGVNGAEIGVFKKTDKVGFGSFLEGKDGRRLEAKIVLKVLGNFTDQTLKGRLADQELRRLLVFANLAEGNRTRAVTVRLLDTTRCRRALAGSLGGELLARRLASSRFTGRLLGTSHGGRLVVVGKRRDCGVWKRKKKEQKLNCEHCFVWSNFDEKVEHRFVVSSNASPPVCTPRVRDTHECAQASHATKSIRQHAHNDGDDEKKQSIKQRIKSIDSSSKGDNG